MKKTLLSFLTFITLLSVKAQQGYHIQLSSSNSVYFHKSDSMYMSVSVGSATNAYMALIDPTTKSWKYINSNHFPTTGIPVMKDKNNGLTYTSGGGSVCVTTDGWQTVTAVANGLKYINKSPAGYYGFYNATSSSYTLCSSTNGLTWNNVQPANTILAARNVGNKIFALGGSSQSYVSMDGGLTYTNVANTGTFTGTFVDFYMPSIDTFIVFMNDKICRSYDAGVTWTNTALPMLINKVAVKNKNEFAVTLTTGPATFSFTTNGGATWSVNATPLPSNMVGVLMYYNNYYYVTPSCRTNDLGTTWDQFLPDAFTYRSYSIDFNGSKGLLGVQNGRYSYSTDKGTTFKTFTNTISSNQDIMAAKVLSNGNFLAGDRKGQVFTSSNNGQSWTQKNTESFSPNSVRFLTSANENTIVLTRVGVPVVSNDAGATFSVVVYSVNGGSHLQALKPNGQMMDIRDINGWEMRTFDINGTTSVIATYSSTGNEGINAFYMADNNVGYIMTLDNTNKINKFYRTNDGGLTFTAKTDIAQVTAGASAYATSGLYGTPFIHCFGVDTVIIAANYANYYHITYNGGTTWNVVTPSFVPGVANYGNYIYRMNFFTSNSYIGITGDTFGPKGLYMNTSGSSAAVGIKELNFENKKDKLTMFPNPSANSHLISLLNLEEEVQVSIFNMNGQFIRSEVTNSGTFSIEGLTAGMYIVTVKEKNKAPRTAKLIVQ